MSIDYGSEESFISNYNKLKSAEKMDILYGVSKTSILNHAKKIGYNVRDSKNYKLSQEDKEEILRSYYYKTSGELAKEYNVSRGMITKLWYDNNLTGKEKSRKYYLNNPNYFENINTEEKAYFLGFIAADGCIYDPKDSRQTIIRIGISKTDKEILEKFQKELGTNKPITEIVRNNKEYSSLEISSQIIGDDLKELGLTPRKTYKKTWVELDNIFLQNAFIRGYFDGDGGNCVVGNGRCFVWVEPVKPNKFGGGVAFGLVECIKFVEACVDIVGCITAGDAPVRVGVEKLVNIAIEGVVADKF